MVMQIIIVQAIYNCFVVIAMRLHPTMEEKIKIPHELIDIILCNLQIDVTR